MRIDPARGPGFFVVGAGLRVALQHQFAAQHDRDDDAAMVDALAAEQALDRDRPKAVEQFRDAFVVHGGMMSRGFALVTTRRTATNMAGFRLKVQNPFGALPCRFYSKGPAAAVRYISR